MGKGSNSVQQKLNVSRDIQTKILMYKYSIPDKLWIIILIRIKKCVHNNISSLLTNTIETKFNLDLNFSNELQDVYT